ncbi:MAG: hypothetical protein FWF82_02130 [Oscillospiraceae bacterium]|nr:hypothetical protein [Oscillospiraceae bacterium]
MKKITALIICVSMAMTLLVCFAGCKNDENNGNSDNSTTTTANTDAATTTANSDNTESTDTTTESEDNQPSGNGLVELLESIYADYYEAKGIDFAALSEEQYENNNRLMELGEIIWGEDFDKLPQEEQDELSAEQEQRQSRNNKILSQLLPIAPIQELTKDGNQGGQPITYYIGADDVDFTEAVASEPMINGGYSVVLLRMGENADIETEMAKIKNNVDPGKWICQVIDPQNVVVDSVAGLIILIMTNDDGQREGIHEAFLALGE